MASPIMARSFYQPEGEVVTQTSGGGLPGLAGGGGLSSRTIEALIAQRAAQAQREAALRERMMMAQLRAMEQQGRMQAQPQGVMSEPGFGSASQGQARANQLQLQALEQQVRGKPVFTKTVGGPGMIGGTIRLNQWEPGAAFSGYSSDLGAGPANAAIESPGPSAASLDVSGTTDLARRQGEALLRRSQGNEFEGPGYQKSRIPRLY